MTMKKGSHQEAEAAAAKQRHHETAEMIATFAKQRLVPPPLMAPASAPATAVHYTSFFSTIGFGIDPSMEMASNDATVAGTKAVQEALERGLLDTTGLSNLSLHLKLGVPAKISGLALEAMHVDTATLTSLLPSGLPILPMEVCIGGILVPKGGTKAMCTAVACVSLLQRQEEPSTAAATAAQLLRSSPTSLECNMLPSSASASPRSVTTYSHHHHHQELSSSSEAMLDAPSIAPGSQLPAGPATGALLLDATTTASQQSQPLSPQDDAAPTVALPTGLPQGAVSGPPKKRPCHQQQVQPPRQASALQENNPRSAKTTAPLPVPCSSSVAPCRNTSIEMLARISAEMHEVHERQQPSKEATTLSPTDGGTMCSADNSSAPEPVASAAAMQVTSTTSSVNPNYNYKKLPPGVTPKNNKRLFVKHQYRDYALELPRREEHDLVTASTAMPIRTPNAAFPLKLHETLAQIEHDGLAHIIGWLPHGRSFKIFQQQEFADKILPQYFVMTKKSSFLRQLNLYGFNRLTRLGPDHASYYHEKFLRGMKFLSRRMQRQKVNGNGIRAAGNPDEEPDFFKFSPCPPTAVLPAAATAPLLSVDTSAMTGVAAAAAAMTQQSSLALTAAMSLPVALAAAAAAVPPGLAGISEAALPRRCSSGTTNVNPSTTVSAGTQISFPLKLQRILDKLESEGKTDIISWLSHGRAFLVRDSHRFVVELMPHWFNQSKYSSFQRQLHMYNFQRITAPGSRDKGAYHHPDFLRGRPDLAMTMRRTRVNGKGTRKPGNPEVEPDFHSLPCLDMISPGSMIEIPLDAASRGDSSTSSSKGNSSGEDDGSLEESCLK